MINEQKPYHTTSFSECNDGFSEERNENDYDFIVNTMKLALYKELGLHQKLRCARALLTHEEIFFY